MFASSTKESLGKNTANTFCSSNAGKEAKVCRKWGAYWLCFSGRQAEHDYVYLYSPMGFVSTRLRIAKRKMRKKMEIEKRASTIRLLRLWLAWTRRGCKRGEGLYLIKSEFSVLYAHVRTRLRYRQPGHTV